MKKQPKQGILRKTVNEGRYTINARTGERLHPKTGEPLPAKEKPVTMKQMFAQKPVAKKPAGLSLDQVWRKVEDVVSSVYPDGDPIDHLAPWLEKQGIKGHQVGDVLRKAAVKNGYSDVYDYFNSMGDLSEASERWVVKYWDKQSENSPAEREFSSKDRANAFLATLPADYIKSLRPSSGPRQDQGMGESYDEYEDDEQQDEGFFVVIGDEEDYSVFIGMLVKEDGKWRERTYSGNPPTNWGGTYMGYLTPQDVMSWLQKDYGRYYQVDGPFDSEEEANQHADMLREAAPSIKPRVVNPDARANILSRRKALQAIIMDPDTARDPALRREVARKKAELARMEREAGMVSEDQGGAVEAYGYAYNRKDQRVTWRRVFKSAEAAQAWAAKRNATVLGTRPVDGKQQGISEGPNDGKEDNFTIDDIKNLEQIQDLETLKARAKELIKGKPARRMKPEKISWFYNHIDNLKRPLDVIKMMYDLLLAGEGNKVIGTRHTMANNSYRQRFGEQSVEEGYEGDDRGDYHETARAANQASRTAKSKQDHTRAADLHDRAATYGLSAGQDQSVIRDHQMAAWEHKRASKGLREGSVESASELKYWDKQAEAISAPLGEALGSDAYTITQRDKNSYVVGTRETRGPVLDMAYWIFKEVAAKEGVTVFTKSGKALPNTPDSRLFVLNRKPNLVYKFEDPTDAEKILNAAIANAAKKVEKEQAEKQKHKEEAPLRKKQAAAHAAERRKADLAKYDAKYGKGTWNRVTYRQEGGDDGYQYVVRVDGRPYMNGLTRREAEYYKLQQVKAIAKRERLGSYANIAPAAPDDTGVTEASRGHTIEAHGVRVSEDKQYEMMMRNGQVKKFVAKDDAEARRIAKGNGAKSVIRLKGGVPAGKVLEQGVSEGLPGSLSKSDYTPGKTVKHKDTNCTTCHGRKAMYKLGNKLYADNKPGATKVKCPSCKGTGDKQGVAEGFGDVVKGIKRKVAGKEDPKEVEHMYGRIARSAIKHKTPDQAEKDIGRYKKVAKVVNKKG